VTIHAIDNEAFIYLEMKNVAFGKKIVPQK
jgi:hypothetical protein